MQGPAKDKLRWKCLWRRATGCDSSHQQQQNRTSANCCHGSNTNNCRLVAFTVWPLWAECDVHNEIIFWSVYQLVRHFYFITNQWFLRIDCVKTLVLLVGRNQVESFSDRCGLQLCRCNRWHVTHDRVLKNVPTSYHLLLITTTRPRYAKPFEPTSKNDLFF